MQQLYTYTVTCDSFLLSHVRAHTQLTVVVVLSSLLYCTLPCLFRVSARKLSITLARKQLYTDIYSEVGKAASAQVTNVEQSTAGNVEGAEVGAKSGTADGSVEELSGTTGSRGRKRAAVEALRQEEQQVCMHVPFIYCTCNIRVCVCLCVCVYTLVPLLMSVSIRT